MKITTDGVQFLHALTRNAGGNEFFRLFEVPADKADKTRTRVLSASGLAKELAAFDISPKCHYYLSANSSSVETFQEDNMLPRSIVLDIDCHEDDCPSYLRDAEIDEFLFLLTNEKFEGAFSQPNAVVKTGRGIHLWWFLAPCKADRERKQLWKNTATGLAKDLSAELSAFGNLELDLQASTNFMGDFRIPGTFNPKSGTVSQVLMLNTEVYQLEVIASQYPVIHTAIPADSASFSLPDPVSQSWTENMLSAIEKLRAARNAKQGCEMRNNYCFVYYCLLSSIYSDEYECDKRMERFNQGFLQPMSPSELRSTLCSAKRKHYRMYLSSIRKYLHITDSEMQKFGFDDPEIPDKSNARPTTETKSDIVAYYMSHAVTQQETADHFGLSRNTVQKILSKAGAIEKRKQGRKQTVAALRSRKDLSAKEIAEKAGVSVRQVWNILKTAGETDSAAPIEPIESKPAPQVLSEPASVVVCPFADLIDTVMESRSFTQVTDENVIAVIAEKLWDIYQSRIDLDAFTKRLGAFLKEVFIEELPSLDDVEAEFSHPLTWEQAEMWDDALLLSCS